MKTRLFYALLFVSSLTFSQVYVSANATGNNSGTSWANAYTNLQTAITNVSANGEIWVAKGTYKPHPTNRTIFFEINKLGVKLYGGFAGTETNVSDRDMSLIHTTNATIISGDLQGNDDANITFNNTTRSDNSNHLFIIKGNEITVNGFLFTSSNSITGQAKGGAIYKFDNNSNTTIEYCKFEKNVGVGGGTIYLGHNIITPSTITVNANIFENNLAVWGTTFYADPKKGTLTLNFTNNLVVNNSTKQYDNTLLGYGSAGGYIYTNSYSPAVTTYIVNNTFVNNKNDGASSNSDYATIALVNGNGTGNAIISNNIFWGNTKNSNATALAIGRLISSSPMFNTKVYYSIDENGFSNIATNKKTNASRTNPNLTSNFKLQPSSAAALDSGINNKIPSGITTDLAGSIRIVNTAVDIGCYEFNNPLSRIYVNGAVSGGDGSGDSWVNAIPSLQTALQTTGTNTTEIWVAKGTYKPGTARTDTFIVERENLSIYGGFDGTEANLSDRDMSKIHTDNATILSGDLNDNDDANISYNNSTRNDNSLRIVQVSANNIVIDGIIIASGFADATSGEGRYGAGLKTANSVQNFTIKNSIIKNNISFWAAGLALHSGVDNSNMTIHACIFENNLASSSVSFYTLPSANKTMNVTVTNSLFKHNTSRNNGSSRVASGSSAGWIRAAYRNSTINATVVNNTFVNNENGGSASSSDFATLGISQVSRGGTLGTLNIANNIFWGNTRSNGSRALAIGKITESISTSMKIFNSIDNDNFSNIATSNKTNTSNSNPNFTSATDFTLQTGSPAINAGDNSKIPSGVTTDLAGNDRIKNTTVDIGAYEFGSATASINDETFNNTVRMYPNPVQTTLYISASQTDIATITVFNVLGKQVLQSKQTNVNVSGLANGMYIIKIQSVDDKIATKKFLKQ